MEDAEKELWKAMRQYIAVGLEIVKSDNERINAVRREIDEIKRRNQR